MSTTEYFITEPRSATPGTSLWGPFSREEIGDMGASAREPMVVTVASAPARHIEGRRSAAGLPTDPCWFVTRVELRPSRADQYPITVEGMTVDTGRLPERFGWRLPTAAIRSERYVFAEGVVDPRPALRLAEGVRAARQGRREAVHARSCTEPTCGACPTAPAPPF